MMPTPEDLAATLRNYDAYVRMFDRTQQEAITPSAPAREKPRLRVIEGGRKDG